MTLRITASDLLDMEADIGRGVEVEVAIDSFGVRFTVLFEAKRPRELLQAAYVVDLYHADTLKPEVRILPEITDQLRKMIQKELDQGSE